MTTAGSGSFGGVVFVGRTPTSAADAHVGQLRGDSRVQFPGKSRSGDQIWKNYVALGGSACQVEQSSTCRQAASSYPALRKKSEFGLTSGFMPFLISAAHSGNRLPILLNFAQRSRNVATASRSPASTSFRASDMSIWV